MKWFILASVPVAVAGLLLFRVEIDPGTKPVHVQLRNVRDMTMIDPWTYNGPGEVILQDQPVSRPESGNDNSLLFKNILVCIP